MNLSIKGLNEINEAFERLPKVVVDKAARYGLRAAGQVYRDGMSSRAPRGETGMLAAGIVFKTVVRRGRAMVYVGPAKDVYYGAFVELGTRYQSAQPFMRPTLYEDGESAVRAFMDATRDKLENIRVANEPAGVQT